MVLWSWIRPFYMFYTHISHTNTIKYTNKSWFGKGSCLICLLASKCMTIFLILSWGQFFWAWHSHGPLLQAWTSARETCNISATAWMKMVFFWYTAHTLPETNIFAPETVELEDDPFLLGWKASCQVRSVSFGECSIPSLDFNDFYRSIPFQWRLSHRSIATKSGAYEDSVELS